MPDRPTTPTHPDHKTDKALEDTFPASDAPGVTPPAGSRKAEQHQAEEAARKKDPHGVEGGDAAAEQSPSGYPTDDRHKTDTAAGA